jgi:hypothetical protein
VEEDEEDEDEEEKRKDDEAGTAPARERVERARQAGEGVGEQWIRDEVGSRQETELGRRDGMAGEGETR